MQWGTSARIQPEAVHIQIANKPLPEGLAQLEWKDFQQFVVWHEQHCVQQNHHRFSLPQKYECQHSNTALGWRIIQSEPAQ